eukprot:COSAG01_NODE_10679_length_2106_cov_4.007256_2_plen_389_part_01
MLRSHLCRCSSHGAPLPRIDDSSSDPPAAWPRAVSLMRAGIPFVLQGIPAFNRVATAQLFSPGAMRQHTSRKHKRIAQPAACTWGRSTHTQLELSRAVLRQPLWVACFAEVREILVRTDDGALTLCLAWVPRHHLRLLAVAGVRAQPFEGWLTTHPEGFLCKGHHMTRRHANMSFEEVDSLMALAVAPDEAGGSSERATTTTTTTTRSSSSTTASSTPGAVVRGAAVRTSLAALREALQPPQPGPADEAEIDLTKSDERSSEPAEQHTAQRAHRSQEAARADSNADELHELEMLWAPLFAPLGALMRQARKLTTQSSRSSDSVRANKAISDTGVGLWAHRKILGGKADRLAEIWLGGGGPAVAVAVAVAVLRRRGGLLRSERPPVAVRS